MASRPPKKQAPRGKAERSKPPRGKSARPPSKPARGPAPGRRTPLPHVQGEETRYGDERQAQRLSTAFMVRPDQREEPIRGVHGLHPYPARLHPSWVRALLPLCPEGPVLDPFCGSGTVLVEAQRVGRAGCGSDLNDVALRIARQRTALRDDRWLEDFLQAASRIHEAASERRETPYAVLAKGEKAFPKHVLAQLISLRAAIADDPDPERREAYLILLSPLLGKFGARRDRPAPEVNRRAVRDHWLRRCEQAAEAWFDHRRSVPEDTPPPRIFRGDARQTNWPDHGAAAIITSPPYPGVYDYVGEQEQRSRWLGDEGWMEQARRSELGRRGSPAGLWVKGMDAVLREMSRITRRGAAIFLVIGDGAAGGEVVRADQVIRRILHTRGFPLSRVAMVSQDRPHFHRESVGLFSQRPRREHLIQLERR